MGFLLLRECPRDGVERKYRVLPRRDAHPLDQDHGLIDREQLAFVVVGDRRQGVVNEFDAAAIEQRPVARRRHQDRPTAVILYADDATADCPGRHLCFFRFHLT